MDAALQSWRGAVSSLPATPTPSRALLMVIMMVVTLAVVVASPWLGRRRFRSRFLLCLTSVFVVSSQPNLAFGAVLLYLWSIDVEVARLYNQPALATPVSATSTPQATDASKTPARRASSPAPSRSPTPESLASPVLQSKLRSVLGGEFMLPKDKPSLVALYRKHCM